MSLMDDIKRKREGTSGSGSTNPLDSRSRRPREPREPPSGTRLWTSLALVFVGTAVALFIGLVVALALVYYALKVDLGWRHWVAAALGITVNIILIGVAIS